MDVGTRAGNGCDIGVCYGGIIQLIQRSLIKYLVVRVLDLRSRVKQTFLARVVTHDSPAPIECCDSNRET